MKHALLVLAVAVGAAPADANAGVAPTNGNFFVGFTDIEMPQVNFSIDQLKVQRIYNSSATFRGMFGYGWGNDFDAYLVPSADGSIVVQESGGGAKTRFKQPQFEMEELSVLLTRIVAAKTLKAGNDRHFDARSYRERLTSDANFRDEEARDLGLLRDLPEGTVLYSTTRGNQQIRRLATGYLRDYGNGRKERYEFKGDVRDLGVDPTTMRTLRGVYKITRIEYAGSAGTVSLEYDSSSGYLQKVTGLGGQTLWFQHDKDGLVVRIDSNLGTTATYRYCASTNYDAKAKCRQLDLIWSQDLDGGINRYSYDERHNMTEIFAGEKIDTAIAYWNDDSKPYSGAVKSLETDAKTKDYSYWRDPAAPLTHYRTTVVATDAKGEISRESYEYWDKSRSDGSSYKFKELLKFDEFQLETTYNECCERPLKVVANSIDERNFEYYPSSNLLRELKTTDQIKRWGYSDKFYGRVTRATVLSKDAKVKTEAFFDYNDNGRLVGARSSGRALIIAYDSQDRVATLTEEGGRTISFAYGVLTKPTRLSIEGLGALVVTYGKDGAIEDVKSEGTANPSEVSREVAAMFGSLTELTKLATVDQR